MYVCMYVCKYVCMYTLAQLDKLTRLAAKRACSLWLTAAVVCRGRRCALIAAPLRHLREELINLQKKNLKNLLCSICL